ncbi:uncharacterized protein SETTUDRAFT_169459, partial [Exserohilum turcica Et28A]
MEKTLLATVRIYTRLIQNMPASTAMSASISYTRWSAYVRKSSSRSSQGTRHTRTLSMPSISD